MLHQPVVFHQFPVPQIRSQQSHRCRTVVEFHGAPANSGQQEHMIDTSAISTTSSTFMLLVVGVDEQRNICKHCR